MNQIRLQSFFDDAAGLPRSTTLLRENGLRAILLHLKPGEQIPEHQARGAITVHCLRGRAMFTAGGERIELKASSLISVAPALPHNVAAEEDTLLLVTMAEQAVASPGTE